MTTETKKRTPKPAMTPAIGDFIRLYLPFLDATNDEQRLIAGVDIGLDSEGIRFAPRVRDDNKVYWVSNRDIYIAKARKEWERAEVEHLRKTAEKISDSIRCKIYGHLACMVGEKAADDYAHLLMGEPETFDAEGVSIQLCRTKWPDGFGKEPDRRLLGKWLESAANMHKWQALWLYPERDRPKKTSVEKWPVRIRAWGASLVMQIFSGGTGTSLNDGVLDVVEPHEAPALSFIGACPRCGKIFEKKRGDQEYCSRACLEVEAKRRQRKSKSTY